MPPLACAAAAIAENSGSGQAIYDSDATDPVTDGLSKPVAYSLKAVDDFGSFSIDSSTGL